MCIIHCGKARCGDDGGDLEARVAQRRCEAPVQRQDVGGDDECRKSDGAQIPAQLLAFEYAPELPQQQKIIQVEVHAEQDHKDRDHDICIQAVVGCDAQVAHGKTACARRGKRICDRIKQLHAAQKQQKDLGNRQRKVDRI